MPVTHETDHAGKLVARLTDNLRAIPEVVSWLSVYAPEIQLLEDAFADLREKTGLRGEGAQLDQVGRLVLEARAGDPDDVYLRRLKAKIRALKSSGTLQDLLDVFKILLPDNRLYFTVAGSGDLEYVVGSIGSADFVPVYSRLAKMAKDAGARLDLVFWIDDDEHTLTLGPRVLSHPGTVGHPSGAFGIIAHSLDWVLQGDVIVFGWGTTDSQAREVLSVYPTAINFTPNTTADIPEHSTVHVAAHLGEWAALTGASFNVALETALPFASGHPFHVGDELLVDPGTPNSQEPAVVTTTTPTQVNVTKPAGGTLAHAHGTGTYVVPRPHDGLGTLADATAGGGLAGVVVS